MERFTTKMASNPEEDIITSFLNEDNIFTTTISLFQILSWWSCQRQEGDMIKILILWPRY